MSETFINDCGEPNPLGKNLNLDPVNPYCPECKEPSQKDVPLFENINRRKTGIGQSATCDPMQSGRIVDDLSASPNRNIIYRYSKAKRGCDEAVMDLFKDLVVIDEHGTAHPIPIIWATQERAVAAIIQENVRKDNTAVVDRLKLPMLAIYDSDFSLNQDRYIYHQAVDYMRQMRRDGKPGLTQNERYERDTVFGVARGIPVDIGYTLYAWTLYKEDMNQIVEQIVLKFSPIAYIRVQGVHWETIVKLESIANNENMEPGGTNLRVIKWQFNLKAETFIPQPIQRKKAVLKTRTDVLDNIDEEEVSKIIARLEESTES